MLAMPNLADFRVQQQIAHEIYRQQIMQRLPDPFSTIVGYGMQQAHFMPAHPPLPEVGAKLENNDLWQKFHKIGTEMIITKSGRRMFPSMRVSLSGLDDDSNYCVLLEMLPIGDCRYKFSGSQWVPAGGAEPQSPQRMYLHSDSPATGAHWKSQALLFNKVKLTNNTLDSNGHIVLASMHKYQPRIHVICTADLAQIPWAPQQAFVFPETEFVAVTAYQNDRITKLKIDNNPFAKGFRETGQSRCKRKLSNSTENENGFELDSEEHGNGNGNDSPLTKRMRSLENSATLEAVSLAEDALELSHKQYLELIDANLRSTLLPQHIYAVPQHFSLAAHHHHHHQQQHHADIDYARNIANVATSYPNWESHLSSSSSRLSSSSPVTIEDCESQTSVSSEQECVDPIIDVVSTSTAATNVANDMRTSCVPTNAQKRSSFSISDILGNGSSVSL